ncbi:Nuclear factor related to kappa-B-binding protein [Taenia solium]|eukprot:TsM_000882600 transcript=TsM_000882600 gene=TsM_000882600
MQRYCQEEERYSRPWEPYIYNQHGYAAVVGPVLRTVGGEGGSRMRTALSAREHPLLRPNRPPWVSLSEIVRDAVARLPNGEGTRPEIAMLVQDSGFLVASFSPKQLNQCISSALDRLQSEGANSPVMYDPVQRLWIYRFRHLSPPDFCRLYKDQIAYQRERFFQIYPGGGYRRPTNRPQPRRRREEPLDDRHIPDIEELTREEEEMEVGDEEYYSSSTDDDSREEEGGASMAFFSQPRRMRLEYKHHQHHSHHSEQMIIPRHNGGDNEAEVTGYGDRGDADASVEEYSSRFEEGDFPFKGELIQCGEWCLNTIISKVAASAGIHKAIVRFSHLIYAIHCKEKTLDAQRS